MTHPRRRGAALDRRDFLRLAGASALGTGAALGAAGCRGLVPHTAQDDARSLSISWWAEGDLNRLHVEVVKAFEAARSGVTVRPEYQPLNGYEDKLSTQMSGGNQPDVFMLRRATFSEYISRGVVRQLDDLVPDVLPFERLPGPLQSTAQYKGHWFAIPLGLATSPGIVADQTVLDDLGIAAPGADWTLDELDELMRAVSTGTGGRTYGANDMAASEYALGAYLAGGGKLLFSDEGQLGFTKDDLGTWLERWQRYRTDGLVVPMSVSSASTGFATDPLVTGAAAMTLTASSKGINGLQPLVDHRLSLLSFPRRSAGSPTATSVGPIEWFALSSRLDAAKAKVASELAMTFVDSTDAVMTLDLAHGVPLLPETREQTYGKQSRINQMLYDNVDEIERLGPAPVPSYPRGSTELLGDLANQNQLVGFGETTIDKAVDEVFASAERNLT